MRRFLAITLALLSLAAPAVADAGVRDFYLDGGANRTFAVGPGGMYNCVNYYDGWALPPTYFTTILVSPGGSERRQSGLSVWTVPGGQLAFDGNTFVNWSPTRLHVTAYC